MEEEGGRWDELTFHFVMLRLIGRAPMTSLPAVCGARAQQYNKEHDDSAMTDVTKPNSKVIGSVCDYECRYSVSLYTAIEFMTGVLTMFWEVEPVECGYVDVASYNGIISNPF